MADSTAVRPDHGHPVPDIQDAAITVRGVSKVFDPDGPRPVEALRNVSFDVPQGGFVSLIGPSGCGKSTLLRLIAGLDEPTSGALTVRGMSPDAARRGGEYGIVFQKPVLFDWRSVRRNVALPLELIGRPKAEIRDRVDHLLELVGLADFADHQPWQLSGGMQQRVAIARALTCNPALVLMDEPFGALDLITRDRMGDELLRIWASSPGTAVVFITHSIAEAALLSDTVVVMSARPGQVEAIVPIDLPRPRSEEVRESDAFFDIERELRRALLKAEGR